MFTLAETARSQGGGHPLWHYLVVAGAAVGVFVGIKVTEYERQRRSLRGNAPRGREVSSGFAAASVSTIVLAAASILSAGIHGSVTNEHFHEAFAFGAFFLAAAAAQVAWAVLYVHRPTRALLVVGAIGNALVIAVWVMSRTVGLPIGPEPGQPEAIGVLDAVTKVFELVVVVTAVALLARRALTREGIVERRLEELRRQHPTLVRPPDMRTPASAVAGAAARRGFLLHEPASGRQSGVAPAVVEGEGSCDIADDDIVRESVL